ncbi:hypothetical protein [Neobacillus niacini]|uniref:hypothetical protein n=1 Tax=Neobacillus niacini TaxID=86668 RepID=UPI00286C6E47|nr:hypothetical protein [Neobacillus niacini]
MNAMIKNGYKVEFISAAELVVFFMKIRSDKPHTTCGELNAEEENALFSTL